MGLWDQLTAPMRPLIAERIRRSPEILELFHNVDEAKVPRTGDREYGSSGTPLQGNGIVDWDEYNPTLTGNSFFSLVDQMRKADGDCRAALQICKLPILRTDAKITVEEDSKANNEDRKLADMLQRKLLTEHEMHETFQDQLKNILLMFDFGYSVAEKVWDVDEELVIRPMRLAPRHPRTIRDFKVGSDGILKTVIQDPVPGGKAREARIPAPTYATVFSWDREGDNYRGQSLLRVMYKHWWYKEQLYKIDAVRLDRWGSGIPDAEVATGTELRPKQKSDLVTLMRGLRGNERSFIIRPETVKIRIMTPEGQGGALGLMDSVNHHSMMIFRSVLGSFMAQGQTPYGNYGSTRSFTDLFLFSLYAAAKFIEDEYTRQVIYPICNVNHNMVLADGRRRLYPHLKFADVQRFDMGLISETLSRLSSAKIITPDDDLESFFRKTFGWPVTPKEWTREFLRENPELVAPGDPANPPGGGRPPEPNANQNRNVPANKTK